MTYAVVKLLMTFGYAIVKEPIPKIYGEYPVHAAGLSWDEAEAIRKLLESILDEEVEQSV